jgi:nitroreductase
MPGRDSALARDATMTELLPLTADEVLSTTRAVRKRLDLSRPVPDDIIRDCVRLALQAPAGSNIPRTRFVVVRDPETRRKLAALYHEVYSELYTKSASYVRKVGRPAAGSEVQDRRQRVGDSVDHLAQHLGEVPVIVVACLAGMRVDGELAHMATTFLGQSCPAVWNFMLAARARGLGTCWTTMHMPREREAAELLGIPYDTVQQVCLTPLAYTTGTDFRPAHREDPEVYIHWDRWDPGKPVPAPWPGFANRKTTDGNEDTVTDVEEILNVMSRYCRAVDDRDWDGLAQLLADDVRFEMGDVTESRDELFAYMKANLWPAGRHLYMNPAVTVDGDTAHVDSDWVWLDPTFAVGGTGRYSDDLKRINGRWVFSARRISMATKAEASHVE